MLFMKGVKTAYKGNMVVHPDVASQMILKSSIIKNKDIERYRLSEKEINIIEGIARGLSNKEIAEELFLSEGTIKNNITSILSKLELRDRTQIAIFAFKNGIMT